MTSERAARYPAAAAAPALLLGFLLSACTPGGPGGGIGGLPVGSEAPEIEASGWLGGHKPADEDLEGNVVVVEAWATWCEPCRRRAPHLVDVYQRVRDRGVVFIGLTDQPESALPKIRRFVQQMGIPWYIGYGATETLDAFDRTVYPTLWVIGPDGTVVWNSDSPGTLEEGIERALASAGRGAPEA